MNNRQTSFFSRCVYKFIKFSVRLFYGKTTIVGIENLPQKNTIIVGNHTQMNGPIIGELFLPNNCFTWCAGEMMALKEVPAYAYKDFWSQKPLFTLPFYKILSYIIAPLACCIFNNARTIAVYHDNRVISTFRETVRHIDNGGNVLIFPEKDEKHNNILYKFQEHFIDVAKLYYKKTGVELDFIPIYIAPTLKKVYVGESIKFDGENDIQSERNRISTYLSEQITSIARGLPEHIVVPYRNIPKKHYLTNKDITEVPK